MQFTFGDEREIYLLGVSALPVTEKEIMGDGKKSIGPGMKFNMQFLLNNMFQVSLQKFSFALDI